MFALWPGEWLNFSNFKLQRLVSWDNARLRKPATSQTQTLAANGARHLGQHVKSYKDSADEGFKNQKIKNGLRIVDDEPSFQSSSLLDKVGK